MNQDIHKKVNCKNDSKRRLSFSQPPQKRPRLLQSHHGTKLLKKVILPARFGGLKELLEMFIFDFARITVNLCMNGLPAPVGFNCQL